MRAMFNAEEARSTIISRLMPLAAEAVEIGHAHGRVLAEDISAEFDVPSFDNAAMDGYAVRSADTRHIPTRLRVAGESAAGKPWTSGTQPGEAIAIMTGAAVPAGADAVAPVEWTMREGDDSVVLQRPVDIGLNIRKRGGECTEGSVLLSRGTRLRAQEVGLLATLGRRTLRVVEVPRVAIMTTGNEIVDVGTTRTAGQIYNSNVHLLSALVRDTGAEPIDLGNAPDDEPSLRMLVRDGLTCHALITSGGVSVGKYDLVGQVLRGLGVDILVEKVNIKPGMPFVFGLHNQAAVFAMPGNPVSAMVTFLQFVRPGLRRMMGEADPGRRLLIPARSTEDMRKHDGKRHFVRGFLERSGDGLSVRTTGGQSSAMLTSLTSANCLIVLPEDCEHVVAGDMVDVELLQ